MHKTTQTKKQTFRHQFQQEYSTCDICVKAHRRYGKLNFRHSSSGIYNNKLFNNKPEGCHCDQFDKEEEEEYDDDESDYSSDEESLITLGHSCGSCFKTFSTETKLHIHIANIHAREEIKGNNNRDFYCLVGNSIIGIDSYNYYEDKMDRLTDLIDALQVNVNRMKRLTTIKE